MSAVLENLHVVELTTGAVGPIVGMFFADFGADVVKVEPAAGDPTRERAVFHMWNRGKRSVVLDWRTADRDALIGLLSRADVVVIPSVAELAEHGIDLDAVRATNPGLVTLEVPPWHGAAPWIGGEENAELLSAATGLAANQASFSGTPVELVEPQVLYVQAAWATCATVAALVERLTSGHGQGVSVTGVNAFAEFGPHLLVFEKGSVPATRALGPGGPNPTYTTYRASDGRWFFVGALPDTFRRRIFMMLGVEDLLDDPRIAQDTDRIFLPENSDWVRERMAAVFATRDREHWLRAIEEQDVPVAEVAEPEEWFAHPHLKAIGGHVVVPLADGGELHMPGSPIALSDSPARVTVVAPALGSTAVDDVTWAEPAPVVLSVPEPGSNGPLAGVKVISLGAYVAGPYAARLLRELGAEVVKVEPSAGDPWRTHGFMVNDGMRGVALDIRDLRGRAALNALIDSADVVMDNFRPGVTKRLGIDHATLSASRPEIVTTSISGFGEVGPLHARPGFDPVLGALSGMQALQGGDAEPVVLSLAVNDTGTAALAALGTTLAVYRARREGVGQHVSCSLAATATYLQTASLVRAPGEGPARRGGRDFKGDCAHARYYETCDGSVRIQSTPHDLRRVVDARLEVEAGDGDPSVEALVAAFRDRTTEEVLAGLERVGIRSTRVRTARDTALDPNLKEVQASHEVTLADGYTYVTLGNLATFSRRTSFGPIHPPGVGEHTTEALRAAGVPEDELTSLLEDGIAIQGVPMVPRVLAQYR